jgi:hypothetical protein
MESGIPAQTMSYGYRLSSGRVHLNNTQSFHLHAPIAVLQRTIIRLMAVVTTIPIVITGYGTEITNRLQINGQ